MKRFLVVALVLGLVTPSLAVAEGIRSEGAAAQPLTSRVEMSDAEMDQVTGGLLTIVAPVTVAGNDIVKDVNVNAAASVAASVVVLGAGAAGAASAARLTD